jgi:hypothetical protein
MGVCDLGYGCGSEMNSAPTGNQNFTTQVSVTLLTELPLLVKKRSLAPYSFSELEQFGYYTDIHKILCNEHASRNFCWPDCETCANPVTANPSRLRVASRSFCFLYLPALYVFQFLTPTPPCNID